MVRIVVDNRIRVETSELSDEQVRKLLEAFTHANPAHAKAKAMGFWSKEKPRIVTATHEHDAAGKPWLSAPRGGMPRIRAALAEAGLDHAVEDRRCRGGAEAGKIPEHRVELRPYQQRVVMEMLAKEQVLVKAPVGCGKTTMAFAFAARCRVPTIILVWTAGLFDQWMERAERELGLSKKDVGRISGKTRVLKPLTVAMVQSLGAWAKQDPDGMREAMLYFGAMVADEVQKMGADSFFQVTDKISAWFRMGMSADQTRKDGKEFLIYDLFGNDAISVKKAELLAAGHVLEVEVRVVPTLFHAPWYGFKGPSAFRGRSHRIPPELDFNRLLEEIGGDFARNRLLLDCVAQELVAGNQVLVLSHRREHAKWVDQNLAAMGVRTGLVLGGPDDRAEFARTIAGLKSGDLRTACGTYQAVGQGIDLPDLGVVVCATPLASNRQQFGQVIGRACRPSPGKKPRLYYLWDERTLGSHLKNLCAWNDRVVIGRGPGAWTSAQQELDRKRQGRINLDT